MYIPQDIVDLIVDQLASMVSGSRRRGYLQAVSLVSTAWVGRCQRHLFSTIMFYHSDDIREWCYRIKPDPDGISRYVRALLLHRGRILQSPLDTDVLKTALPHLTSFKNIQELKVDGVDLNVTSLDVLISIISSFASTLKRFVWAQTPDAARDPWTIISTLVNLLPNLVDLLLSSDPLLDAHRITYPPLSRIQLPHDVRRIDLLAFKYFKFQELRVHVSVPDSPTLFDYCQIHLRALDLRGVSVDDTEHDKNLEALLEACCILEMFTFTFDMGIGRLLSSIASNSVSLIQLHDPIPSIPFKVSASLCSWSPKLFNFYISELEQDALPECRELGVSLQKIAQRFRDHHPGLKTRVRISSELRNENAQAIENVDIPFFQAELEKEAGDCVSFELTPLLVSW